MKSIRASILLNIGLSLGLAICGPLRAAPTSASSASTTPKKEFTGEGLVIKKQFDDLFESSRKVNAGGEVQKAAREKIDSVLDWERVAQDCLGVGQWKKQPSKNKESFSALLREVIVKTAFSRLDTFWDGATYGYEKIDVKGKDAVVVARFDVKGEELTLEYYLTKKGNSWKIHDIAYEGMRYSSNINEQLTAFLKDKGFPNLLDKLRKRRDELNQGTAKTGKS